MSDAITLRLDDAEVIARLNQIAERIGNMTPAMQAIGEILAESAKHRFDTSTDPEGKRWAPNAPATVLARIAQISGAYSPKTGKLTKKGATVAMNKKPLVATGMLQDSIRYQVRPDGMGVEIGTNRFAGEWAGGAAVHQFGREDGSIPARAFLGISAEDRIAVLDVLNLFLEQSTGAKG